jgi:hypothetical protein
VKLETVEEPNVDHASSSSQHLVLPHMANPLSNSLQRPLTTLKTWKGSQGLLLGRYQPTYLVGWLSRCALNGWMNE